MRTLSPTLLILMMVPTLPAELRAQPASTLSAAAELLKGELPAGKVAVARERLCPADNPCPGSTHAASDLQPVLKLLGATPASAASVRSCGATPASCRLLGADVLVLLGPGATDGEVGAVVYSRADSERSPVGRVAYRIELGGRKVVRVGAS